MTNLTHCSQFVLAAARERHALPYVCCISLVALLLIATSLSCSGNKLSRSRAAELIRQANHYPDTAFFCINQGHFLDVRDRALITKPSWNNYDLHETLEKLQNAGYVEYIVREPPRQGLTIQNATIDVRLTAKGEEVFSFPGSLGPNSRRAVVAVSDFLEVTGITYAPGEHAAQVEYSVAYTYISPIAPSLSAFMSFHKAEMNKPLPQTEDFMLYDDGWRIQE